MTAPALAPDTPSRPPIGSVKQAVAVLRHLGSIEGGQGVTHIARELGIGPSSCFNVLRTLVSEDLVAFDPQAKTYRLGLGMLNLAGAALGRNALARAAAAPMEELASRHDAAVGLWRLTAGDRLTLVVLAESESATRIHMAVGQRQPAAAGATGRAVLAARGWDDRAVGDAFDGLRWQSAPSRCEYTQQVRTTRERGFARDIGQINYGISTVAAAICDAPGDPRFVLSASAFSGRHDDAALDGIGRDLAALARRIGAAVYGTQGQEADTGGSHSQDRKTQ